MCPRQWISLQDIAGPNVEWTRSGRKLKMVPVDEDAGWWRDNVCKLE